MRTETLLKKVKTGYTSDTILRTKYKGIERRERDICRLNIKDKRKDNKDGLTFESLST